MFRPHAGPCVPERQKIQATTVACILNRMGVNAEKSCLIEWGLRKGLSSILNLSILFLEIVKTLLRFKVKSLPLWTSHVFN
jgi:hypothetical protein